MRYHVEEGDGTVEVCARMVGLNAKDVAINMSTNDGTAKRMTTVIHSVISVCVNLCPLI